VSLPSAGRLAGLAACLTTCLSTPAAAHEQHAAPAKVSAEELKELEESLGKDAEEPEDGTRPAPAASPAPFTLPSSVDFHGLELSFILDAALAAFTAEKPLQGGAHDPLANGFTFQQLELSVGTAVDPYFRFDGNIVFSQFGVEVEEAYATSTSLPGNLQLRAGQFLTRFGRLNNTHPHSWDFADQPFTHSRLFGGEGNRGLGMELSWLTPLPWFVEVLGSFTDAAGEATARSFFGAEGSRLASPFDFQFTGALKQFFPLSDDLSLMWGLSAATGPNPTGYRNRTDVWGTDVYLKYRPLKGTGFTFVAFQGELFHRRRQVPENLLSDWNGYGQVVWRFDQRWATGARYEFGAPALGLDGRLAEDPLDPDWNTLRQRVSANLTFWPTEFSRVRLQAATDAAGWREQPDYSVFLSMEVVMGAHGAHAF
jgi:hypothetical protein